MQKPENKLALFTWWWLQRFWVHVFASCVEAASWAMGGAERLVAGLGCIVCARAHARDSCQLPLKALTPLEAAKLFCSLLLP